MKIAYYFIAALFLTVPACQTTSDAGEPVQEVVEESAGEFKNEISEMKKKPSMTDPIMGMVRYLDLEGGFYGIEGEDGNKYLPLDLDDAFHEDSLKVRFTFQKREGVMSIAMWGQAVNITSIERAE